jgi:HEAT repeat protein
MRRSVVLLVAASILMLGGCGSVQPKMAGARWAAALHDPDVNVRRKAAFTLGNIGPSDVAALPALIGALKDPDAGVRCEAILALLKFGPPSQDVTSALSEVKDKDRDAKVRSYARTALERLPDPNRS